MKSKLLSGSKMLALMALLLTTFLMSACGVKVSKEGKKDEKTVVNEEKKDLESSETKSDEKVILRVVDWSDKTS